MSIPINLVFEDILSEITMIKMLESFGNKFIIGNSYNGHGFGYIKSNIQGFNEASIATPFFVLTDLDRNLCPGVLIENWLIKPKRNSLIFRIAVRQVEAWLLADIEGLSNFFRISPSLFPINPEEEHDAKKTLITLARRVKRRSFRDDIVPINKNANIGPNYNERLSDFVINHWDIVRARSRASSLDRACISLLEFKFPH